jgi:transcriptional regulator GlxA family with amidase domain
VSQTAETQKREAIACYFLILPGFLPLDLAGPLQVMLSANNHRDLYDIHYLGANPEVAMKGGLMLQQLHPLPDQIPAGSRLIIAGLSQTDRFLSSEQGVEVVNWLSRQSAINFTLITICSGALIAAKSGYMFDKKCTTHQDLIERLQKIESTAQVQSNRLFVQDGNLWSSAGISSGIDMMLAILQIDSDAQFAEQIARDMVVYIRRTGMDSTLSPWMAGRNHLHRRIHQVQDHIINNPHQLLSLDQLAKHCHMSSRHLSRTFKEATGQSVQQYILAIRIALAEKLLTQTPSSIEQVVEACGFNSVRNFRRAWGHKNTISPSHYRKTHH